MTRLQKQLRALLSPAERELLAGLNTPIKIQDFLDHFPEHYPAGKYVLSPRQVLKAKKANCIEGALLAAAARAYHGHAPLLLDLRSAAYDYDHVVVLFKQGGLWGAISKTNHSVLRWRDPVYKTVRELALSYFNEYFWPDNGPRLGLKTMVDYSRPFNVARYHPRTWWAAGKGIGWLAEELDSSPHVRAYPARQSKYLRRANAVEVAAMRLEEHPDFPPKKRKG